MQLIQQGQTAQPLMFLMIDATDHISGKTGLSPTVTLSKNGGSFSSPAGTVTEVGSGWYKVAGNATDAGALGPLVLHASGTGADPVDVVFEIISFNPQDPVRLGLTALPNATAGASGGLPTGNASGHVTLADGSVTAAKQGSDWRTKLAGTQPDYAPAKPGDAMALTSGERTTLATAIEAAIIDDADGDAVLQAIQDKIAALNPTWGELTVGTIASAARDAVLDALLADHVIAGSVAKGLGEVLAKTNNLPPDPASESVAADNRADILDAIGSPLQVDDYAASPTATQIREELDSTSTRLAKLDATISSRSTLTAGQVWGAETRTLSDFGFEIEASIDEETLQETVSNAVSGSLEAGAWSAQDVQQARYQLGLDGTSSAPATAVPHLAVSLGTAGLAQLAGTRQIQIAIPTLSGQELTDPLIQGDSYSASLDAAIEFSRSDFPDLPAGASARLTARKLSGHAPCGDPHTLFMIEGEQASIPVREGVKVVRFEPTSAQTSLWEPGKYEFDVEISFPSGEVRTFIGPNVFLRVLENVNGN